jgi:hypothetical protein
MLSLPIRPTLLGLAAICVTGIATAAEPQQPSPADPAASAGMPAYRSAFSDYQPMQEAAPQDWRTVNDAVARTGGHAGALKENAAAGKPAAMTPAGHAGHKH